MDLTGGGGGKPQSFTQAAPNELKLGKGNEVVGADIRLSVDVGA